MRVIIAALLITAAITLAACGDDDDEDGATTATATATTTPAAPPAEPDAVEQVKPSKGEKAAKKIQQELKKAGFNSSRARPGSDRPKPEAALEVKLSGGGQLKIFIYSSSGNAKQAAKSFDPVERQAPDQIEVQVSGEKLYVGTVEEPAVLDTAQFQQIVQLTEDS
ncbi:MAG TPA: hypothetical protein VFH61_04880 [Thermoleophilia bacterium]|nr:hypothetical protein [Thermoleophilia bacterium]